MKSLSVRASSCDLAWECAESTRHAEGEVRLGRAGEAAELGTAFHKWAEEIDGDPPDLGELSKRYKVDIEELDRLANYARVAWNDIKQWFEHSEASTEVTFANTAPLPNAATEFSHLRLHGTADRVVVIGETAWLLDWKTGFNEGYEHQQRCYAYLVCQQYPDVKVVYSFTVYVRLYFCNPATYTREQLDSWYDDLRTRMTNGLGTFSPGPHCGFCRRHSVCPGAKQFAESAIQHIAKEPLPKLTPENFKEVGPAYCDTYQQIRYIEKRCEEWKKALKEQIQRVGPIPGKSGRGLGISTSKRRSINAKTAWPVLTEYLSEDEINNATSVSLKKCQDALASRMTVDKGGARKELLVALEKAGAVRVKETESLREMKA